mmetsp:Transcript_725/g.2085  ORF Transcript_725/g.2085 Transcript_725/m.2085 type:complete len:1041 (+) Transcript_725:534-3656(+)
MDLTKSDPYLKMSFLGLVKKTSVKRATLNPVWNETIRFSTANVEEKPVLRVEVYDEDLLPDNIKQGDDLMGRFDISIDENLPVGILAQGWFPLVEEAAGSASKPSAAIELELRIVDEHIHRKDSTRSSRLRHRRSRDSATEETVAKTLRLNDESKKLILMGHIGKFRHVKSEVRRIAIRAIAKFAGKDGEEIPEQDNWKRIIIKNLTERIEKDTIADVRLDSLETMFYIGCVGMKEAVKGMCTAMKDPSSEIRLAAVNMIEKIAHPGDEDAIIAVASCIEDSDDLVRAAACEVLPKLSNALDEKLIQQALQRLDHIHAIVRKSAVQVLSKVTIPGSPVAIDGFIKAVYDKDVNVKCIAMEELSQQVQRGDPKAVLAVGEQLDDDRPRIRECAVSCLAKILTREDRFVISKVVAMLQDTSKDPFGNHRIQTAVLDSLCKISEADQGIFSPRTKAVIDNSLLKLLESKDWRVRKTAVNSFAKVSSKTDRDEMLSIFFRVMSDERYEVRTSAIRMLEALRDARDDRVLVALCCHLLSTSHEERNTISTILVDLNLPQLLPREKAFLREVRAGKTPSHGDVMGVLSSLVQQGGDQTLDGFIMCLTHEERSVRTFATESLCHFATQGDERIIGVLKKMLKEVKGVRKYHIAECLSRLSSPTDESSTDILMDLLNHEDREVRKLVPQLLDNILLHTDSRRVLAHAYVVLDSESTTDMEKKEALVAISRLSSASKLEGRSSNLSNLSALWDQIRLPKSQGKADRALLHKISSSLKDSANWVRRAAVEAIQQFVLDRGRMFPRELLELLHDESSAVRIAVIKAIQKFVSEQEMFDLKELYPLMYDESHFVRAEVIKCLRRIASRGDMECARHLMTWLRKSWEYGVDGEHVVAIKRDCAELIIDLLGFQQTEKIDRLFLALEKPLVHMQRNRIAEFEDELVSRKLIPRYDGYRQLVRDVAEMQPQGNYNLTHIFAAIRIQRWILRLARKLRNNPTRMQNKFRILNKEKQLKMKTRWKDGPESKLKIPDFLISDHYAMDEDVRYLGSCVL